MERNFRGSSSKELLNLIRDDLANSILDREYLNCWITVIDVHLKDEEERIQRISYEHEDHSGPY